LFYVYSSNYRSLFEQIKRIFKIDRLPIFMSKLKFLSGNNWKFCKILALLRVVITVIILISLPIMLGCFTNLYR
jgi:hypothetical protein